MYAPHFGWTEDPFTIAPDPRFLFMSQRHDEALAHLVFGLGGGGGFVVLTGEIGTGKTTIFRRFLDELPAHCKLAYVYNPKLSALELLQSITQEFGISLPETSSAKTCIDALNRFLLAEHALGRHAMLVIDEAQHLSAEVLEQLRLLTNLETAERKLLQIVLIGQPELRAVLRRPDLEQLNQRVVARFHLGPLDADDTALYVAHRLSVVGHKGALPFAPKALARLHEVAGGVPRKINLVCARALLGAYGLGQARVDARMVQSAAAEVFDVSEAELKGSAPASNPAMALAAAALAVLVACAAAFALAWWLAR